MNFKQLQLKFIDDVQHRYEVIRPLVLFNDRTILERSQQTKTHPQTIRKYLRCFDERGMGGLFKQKSFLPQYYSRQTLKIPPEIREEVISLKILYPGFSYRELTRVLFSRTGYKIDHKGVKRILSTFPHQFCPKISHKCFHDYANPYEARVEVLKLYYQGWSIKSISNFFKISRTQVYELIRKFEKNEFIGLIDKSKCPRNPKRVVTFPIMARILEFQENPNLGAFRIKSLLELEGIKISQRTVSRVLALHRLLYGLGLPDEFERVIKVAPHRPEYYHQYWFIDVRYLVEIEEKWVYSICILEGYSRAILSSAISSSQDLVVILQVLYSAIETYGIPKEIVSDNGGVFTSHEYLRILTKLEIKPTHIEKGKPWQNLIEAFFGIQSRMVDFYFQKAETYREIEEIQTNFVKIYNDSTHWAHRDRKEGERSPIQVLKDVKGQLISQKDLHRIFYENYFVRQINRRGYASLHNFYLYAEIGLPKTRVFIWIYQGQLKIGYRKELLAKYSCSFDSKKKKLKDVSEPIIYKTRYICRQLYLWDVNDEKWLKIKKRTRKPWTRKIQLQQGRQLNFLAEAKK